MWYRCSTPHVLSFWPSHSIFWQQKVCLSLYPHYPPQFYMKHVLICCHQDRGSSHPLHEPTREETEEVYALNHFSLLMFVSSMFLNSSALNHIFAGPSETEVTGILFFFPSSLYKIFRFATNYCRNGSGLSTNSWLQKTWELNSPSLSTFLCHQNYIMSCSIFSLIFLAMDFYCLCLCVPPKHEEKRM